MSKDQAGRKHDELGPLAETVAAIRDDVPDEAQWQHARHHLMVQLESRAREAARSATGGRRARVSGRRTSGLPWRPLLAATTAACGVAAAVVFAVALFRRPDVVVTPPRPAPRDVGSVDVAYGRCVRVTAEQEESVPESGDGLRPGDRLRVGPGGGVELRLPDGSRLWLCAGTEAECVGPRSNEAPTIRLLRGEIRADIAPDPKNTFSIWTPAGTLEVLGTEFHVRVLPDITQGEQEEAETMKRLRTALNRAILVVSVLSGSVAVEADGQPQIIGEGQRAVLASKSDPADSEKLRRMDYLRAWLGRSRASQELETLAMVPIRPNLLHALVAVDLESGESRRVADFVGCAPRVVQQFGPDMALVKPGSVIFAFFGNQPISGQGRPLVNDQVMLVNLTSGEKIPMVPLSDCDPLYLQLSPDRRKLAFVGNRTPEAGEREFGLFVFDLETFKLEKLLPGALKTSPHWSPDSRWLAISKSPGYQSHHEIVLVDTMTGKVVETGLEGAGVQFSPDGRRLVFSSGFKRSGSFSAGVPTWGNLFTASVSGGKPEQITDLPEGGAIGPSFSPDGTRLLYWQVSKERGAPHRLHEIELDSGEDRVITEGSGFGTLRWLDFNSRFLLSFTEYRTVPQTRRKEPVSRVKLVDVSGEEPSVREFTPEAKAASADETAAQQGLSDRLFDVFVSYRDAVTAQDLHRIEEAQAKYAEARDHLEAIIEELESGESQAPGSLLLQRDDLEPYLDVFAREAALSADGRAAKVVHDNLKFYLRSLLRMNYQMAGCWPKKGGEALEPYTVVDGKPSRPLTFEECCAAAPGQPWQINHIRGTDVERVRRLFVVPGEDPDEVTTSYQVVRSDDQEGVFVLRTPVLPDGTQLEATYRVTGQQRGRVSVDVEVVEVDR